MEKEPKNQEQIIAELKELKAVLWKKPENYERCAAYANELKTRHDDFMNYKLYHFLIGSTPPEYATEFDLPGEDSIEIFFRSL